MKDPMEEYTYFYHLSATEWRQIKNIEQEHRRKIRNVFVHMFKRMGESNVSIARKMEISESTVRYILKKDTFSSGWGREEPQLGLATTRQLLQELEARAEISVIVDEFKHEMTIMGMRMTRLLELLPEEMLNYRTVDDR